MPTGSWEYTVTPVLALHWRAPESGRSTPVSTGSTTPPVNAISLSGVTGGAARTGDTVYYRGAAAGSFTLTNAVTDVDAGPASSTTAALTGSSGGWTHTPSTVSSPAGGPYVSNPFSWSAGTTGSTAEAVTGRDLDDNTATTTMTYTDDSVAPTAGSISYPDGYQSDPLVDVTSSAGTDIGSGISTRQLQRSSAVLAAGVCDTYGAFTDVGPDSPASPFTDSTLSDQTCYRYRLVVTDRVGIRAVSTSPREVKVDSGSGGPLLRSTASYSVLAGTGVANTGATTVSGDLGVSPSSSVAGFPPGIVSGSVHAGDAAAAQGQADLVKAYTDAQSRTATGQFAGDLNGRTFTAGVYHTSAALALTGTVTLDGQDNPNAVFVFQVDAAMDTAAASSVALTHSAQASHVFWQVQGAVGTGANASVSGTIMAAGAITLGDSTTLIGRALSYGTVTMSTNAVRFGAAAPPTVTITGGATAVTKDTTPTISGTTSAVPGTTVRVAVEAQRLTTTAAGDGSWTVTADVLGDGVHVVSASVRDLSGNAGSASQALTVEVNPVAPVLGSTGSYSVLAGVAVANTGATTVSGDLGVSPGSSVTGFPPGIVSGDVHSGDSAAATGRADMEALYADLDGRTPRSEFSGDLAGRTFHDGVFHTSAALALTGTVTLDAEGDPNAVFIFQVDAAMNTAAASSVVLTHSAQASHVFWQVQGAVGTGATSSLAGTIVTPAGITLGADTVLTGRALAEGTVTMASNTLRFTSTLPPSVTITGGATAVTKDTTPTISGSTSAAPGTTVRVAVEAQRLTTTAAGDGSWTVTADVLGDGVHVVSASVRDLSGNAGSASQSLTVEVNPVAPVLGSTGSYSVLAGVAVANTGATTVSGDLGVSPGSSVTGFPPGIVSGDVHAGDATAATGRSDVDSLYTDLGGRTPRTDFSGDLGGRTFHDGVFHTSAAVALTGTVTLDAEGDPNAVFIFQVDAAMNTAAASQVTLANGALASHVFWQVQGAVGTGATSSMAGTIVTPGGITLGADTTLVGRALADGTVTLASNTLRFTTALPPTVTVTGGPTAVTKDTTPTITGTTSATPGTAVRIAVQGQTLTTTAAGDGGWSVTAAALAAGDHTVRATVKDAAGNAGTATQTLTVEVNPGPVDVGSAAPYRVLAATAVANTGLTVVSGDLGVTTVATISGFPPGVVTGTTHNADASATQAQAARATAYADAAGRTPDSSFSGDLGGVTFRAGVHHTAAALALTGTLTLDAEGDANAVFIIQVDAAMNTAAGGTVTLANGALASNVFWQVQGAVGTGALSSLAGTVLTPAGVTLGAGTTLHGRVLSGGTVTLANNPISG